MSAHPVESLSALLDDELDQTERREVETHLAACAACARHLRELTAMDALSRGLPPVAAPDGYLEALPGRVRQRIGADRPRRARAPWMLPLAAGLALAVLAPLVLRDGPSRVPSGEDGLAAPAGTPPAEDGRTAQAVAPPPAAVPPGAGREEARTASRDFAAEQDARPLARARQDAPRRAAPAAEPVAPAPSQSTDSQAADARSAGAMALREAARADAAAAANEPAFAPPPAARAESKQAETQVQATGGLAGPSALRKTERGNAAAESAEERAFRVIAARALSTATEARGVREAWLLFAADHPRGARFDEARVRIVEASVAAFRDGGDPADRLAAQRDAEAYLASANAPQATRVKAALRRLDVPR